MNGNMSPVDWAKRPLQKYADFSGRAPRAEFWWWLLAVIVLSVIAEIIDGMIGMKVAGNYGPLSAIVGVALLVPNIAVSVRRLHDTNHSGWWLLLPVVPYCLAVFLGGAAMMGGAATGSAAGMTAGMGIAGIFMIIGAVCALVLLYFYVQAGTPGDNRYGPNPYDSGGRPVAA
jgi:uncharacterized membrane protein YhaH (DUF805 family)